MQKYIKAEMWDKMQYLFRNYYDRMIHMAFYYKGNVDFNVFKEAVGEMFEQVPILHSAYINNFIKPYWVVREYNIDDAVFYIESEDIQNEVDRFLTQTIKATSNVQMKILVINSKIQTAICVLFNHMCFDGGDGKKIIATLFANYNAKKIGDAPILYRTGRRDFRQVYDKFNDEDKKVTQKLYKNISSVENKNRFPLTKSSKEDKNKIHYLRLPKELVSQLKAKGKENAATLNDLFLGLYIHSLYNLGIDPSSKITIPCMVDLRRHIPDNGENGGYCNHTGFMLVDVPNKSESLLETLEKVKLSTANNKKDKYLGLYGLPLLNLAYTIFPHFISEIAIKIGYTNPLMGMSNVGELKEELYTLVDTELLDAFMTGATKYKPYMQLAMTSCKGNLTLTVAVRCNDKDSEIINFFLSDIERSIKDYVTQAQ